LASALRNVARLLDERDQLAREVTVERQLVCNDGTALIEAAIRQFTHWGHVIGGDDLLVS
jgi:hypothetical protein